MTDHKAEALDWIEFSGDCNPERDPKAMHSVALGQVHATLYLAEQQRVANELTKQIVVAMCATMTASQVEMFQKSQELLIRTAP